MKTVFDKTCRNVLIDRIHALHTGSKAQWGKMNLYQMVKHNTYWNGWLQGKGHHTYRQAFIGKIFGKIAMKRMIRNEKPMDKNVPTSSQFKVKETSGDFIAEKSKWIALIQDYEHYNNPGFVHDFFGKMTRDQIGILVYKHTDHHLRQFES